MRIRVIKDGYHDAYTNMAIDEAILNAAIPTIRFYRWKPSAVSIGYFQSIYEDVNVEECRRNGVDVVRRITGGGAVYHDKEGEITYSIVIPSSLYPDIMESYHAICDAISKALKSVGLNAEHAGINDIVVNGKKISGSAQTRRNDMLLQHGTILLKVDIKKMFSMLNVSEKKIEDKEIKRIEDRVTSVEREFGKAIDGEEIVNEMIYSFSEMLDAETYEEWLTEDEINNAELLREKYESKEWNFKR